MVEWDRKEGRGREGKNLVGAGVRGMEGGGKFSST